MIYSNLGKSVGVVLLALAFVVSPLLVKADTLSIDEIRAQAAQIFQAVSDLQKQIESLNLENGDSAVVDNNTALVTENGCGGLATVSGMQNCEQSLNGNISELESSNTVSEDSLQAEDVNNMASILVAAQAILLQILDMDFSN
jgi:hypothetical protein